MAVPPVDWAALLETMRVEASGGRRQAGGGGGGAPFASLNRHVSQTDAAVAAHVHLGPGIQVGDGLHPEPCPSQIWARDQAVVLNPEGGLLRFIGRGSGVLKPRTDPHGRSVVQALMGETDGAFMAGGF